MARLALASMVLVPLVFVPASALQIIENRVASDVSEGLNASLLNISQSGPTEMEVNVTSGSRVAAGTNASANATGNPWLAATLQFSLTQALEPVRQKLQEIREWLIAKLKQLQDALKKVEGYPAVALTEFSTRVSEVFTTLKEKLEPVTSKLAFAGPVMKTVEQVLDAAGYAGAADKFGEVTSEISEQIQKYQEMLGNSSQIAVELKSLGKNDWQVAGPKIQHLKELLDKGTTTIKKFDEILKDKVHEAMALLSGKLQVDPQTFQPVEKVVSQSWAAMELTVDEISTGTKGAMDQLPAEVTALPSRAVKCMAAVGATVLATATLAM